MVHRVRRYEDDMARTDLFPPVPAYDQAIPLEYENLVFPFVRVMWRMAARRHFEVAHRKVLGPIVLGDEPPHFGSFGTAFSNSVCFHLRIVYGFESHGVTYSQQDAVGI